MPSTPAPTTRPFDVLTLTGRIRRRRTVRTGGARWGGRRRRRGRGVRRRVRRGARSPVRAPRGACRRRARDVRVGHRAAAPADPGGRVLPSPDGAGYQEDPSAAPAGSHLGTLLGRVMNPVLVRRAVPGCSGRRGRRPGAQRERDAGRGGGASRGREADPPDASRHRRPGRRMDRGVQVARQQLEAASSSEPISGTGDEPRQPDPDHPRRTVVAS